MASQGEGGSAPLLLHFDVNKTILLTDSIDSKTCDDCVREAVSELYWGVIESRPPPEGLTWSWVDVTPQARPPPVPSWARPQAEVVAYAEYCRRALDNKKDRRSAMRTFRLVKGTPVFDSMEKFVVEAVERMQLPEEIANERLAEVGLRGRTYLMLPAIFHLTADLVRRKAQFAIVFRSFGKDHAKIKEEWNAFCDQKHPVFSYLLDGHGPLNGTVKGLPDRRLHDIHTLYRDADGPALALNTFTNGPDGKSWDSWAKTEPRPDADTREGRKFLREINAPVIEGLSKMQEWFEGVIKEQSTVAIKDDWAWWTWHGETGETGKLLCLLPSSPKQLFFDDNIDWEDPRIVDCRELDGKPVPKEKSLSRLITKVNPVEALFDSDYFIRALERCHGRSEALQGRAASRSPQSPEVTEAVQPEEKTPPAPSLLWPLSWFGYCCPESPESGAHVNLEVSTSSSSS